MRLKLFDKVLFRVPQFPMDAKLQDSWHELKKSIKGSSEYFYSIIQKMEYGDLEDQPENIKNTIDKYFNRARFRATPYETFASIGICNLIDGHCSPPVIDSTKILHSFPDWKNIESNKHLWKEHSVTHLYLQANSSFYRVGNTIRYIYRVEDKFELSDIPYYNEIEAILFACGQTISYVEFLEKCYDLGLNSLEFKEIVTELIEVQLIYTQFQPNILGEEYFKRIGMRAVASDVNNSCYTICEQRMLSGNLEQKDFLIAAECIDYLQTHQTKTEPSADLTAFRDKFSHKYDLQEVSLMEALDPVIGIGYGDMEVSTSRPTLIRSILEKKNDKVDDDSSPLSQAVKKTMDIQQVECSIINLEKIDIPNSKLNVTMPNTLSAIVQKVDKLILLENLSRATATSLLGRFNHAQGQFSDMTKSLARIEETSNPDILFFDLAYSGEPAVDNVNRRDLVYDYQVCIANWDTADIRIGLNDIMVSVLNGQIILKSRTRQKRMIPRLSTAYNYIRSDLSIFRLLCDIQMQELPYLMPQWESIFEGRPNSPRVQYKNIVLSPANWTISYNNEFGQPQRFMNYLKGLQVSRYIKVGQADQTLLLDTDSSDDIGILFRILKSSKQMKIHEAFVSRNSTLTDEMGRPYVSEYVLSLYHEQQIYKPIPPTTIENNIVRTFPPGSNWLYVKVFCHTDVMDDILNNEVSKILTDVQDFLASWFFIRYDEGGNHIRLRLSAKKNAQIANILVKVNQTLHPLIEQGIITNLQMDTYVRELERYGRAYLVGLEDLFCADSQFLLDRLATYPVVTEHYAAIIRIMILVGERSFGKSGMFNLAMLQKNRFNQEHDMEPQLFKILNTDYKVWIKGHGNLTSDSNETNLARIYIELLQQMDEQNRSQLFCDLFHMHINRTFNTDQRIHEMIIYNYIIMVLKRKSLFIA